MTWDYHTDFADTPEEATARFERALSHDPFPDVGGALLNSAHIAAYAREVGLIHKFLSSRLKSASYPARVGNTICYWNPDAPDDHSPIVRTLELGETFELPQFSLVFVKTEEQFLLPPYIAARFNLQIEFVHKGLLVGTGPIVDPGFAGHLVIPLHNLTTNRYRFARGQQLIWVEFAKTSTRPEWVEGINRKSASEQLADIIADPAFLKKFDKAKLRLTLSDYLDKAQHDRFKDVNSEIMQHYPTIVNAIPRGINAAASTANKASEDAESVRHYVNILSIGGALGALVGLITLGVAVLGVYNQSVGLGEEVLRQREGLQQEVRQLQSQLEGAVSEVRSELVKLRTKESDIDAVLKEFNRMDDKILKLQEQIQRTIPRVPQHAPSPSETNR